MRILLLGPPGAGKGTQAARLAASARIAHVATGDMFRQAVAAGSDLGARVRDVMERGALVPDDLTVAVVRQRLGAGDCGPGFVLDGFPRTLPQAEALDGLLAEIERPLDAAIALEVPDAVVLRRLAGRRVCPRCGATYHVDTDPPGEGGVCRRCGEVVAQRGDDQEETQRRRLEVYQRDTAPLLGYYAAQGRLVAVGGDGPVDVVAGAVLRAALGRQGR